MRMPACVLVRATPNVKVWRRRRRDFVWPSPGAANTQVSFAMVAAADANEDLMPIGPTSGMTASRLAQLRADMLLTPEARVRAAEETLALDRVLHQEVRRSIIGFERYEDFLDYKSNARRLRE